MAEEDRSHQTPSFVADSGLSTRAKARLIIAGILALGMLIFILSNTKDTRVKWLGFDFNAPLWIVLLGSAVAGAVAMSLVGFFWRRRKDD